MYNASKTSAKNKKAKVLKNIGWITGGAITVFGIMGTIGGFSAGDDQAIGPLILCGGIGTWAAFYYSGKHIEKKHMYSVQSSPIYQQEFELGKNDRLMVGVDMLKDNTRKNQTLGLGVSYNF